MKSVGCRVQGAGGTPSHLTRTMRWSTAGWPSWPYTFVPSGYDSGTCLQVLGLQGHLTYKKQRLQGHLADKKLPHSGTCFRNVLDSNRCRANMAYIRQTMPDSGLGFHAQFINCFGFGFTGAPHASEIANPWDPTEGLCLGPCGAPRGGGGFL